MAKLTRGVHLTGWGSYAPSLVLSNADLEKMVETSDEWIVTRTGITERRRARPDQASSDLGYEASVKALEAAGVRVCASPAGIGEKVESLL